ncbi:MAG: hypothetical protein ACKN98_04250, partial [Candidatus Limnocylindrus sp.]
STVGVHLGLFDPRFAVREVEGVHGGERLRYGAYPAPGNRRVWGLTARLLCELASRSATVRENLTADAYNRSGSRNMIDVRAKTGQ